MECREEPIPESQYYSHANSLVGENRANDVGALQTGEDIRYWSDFSRVYCLPRTIQAIPDIGGWENTDGDWQSGQEQFSRYNEVWSLIFSPDGLI
jgi:hypothetical protein